MNIASLFVSLGVKGTDKSLGAISGVRKSLKETASTSLEAKAAILGVIYSLQRMFSISGQIGTDLTNFNATLGVSTKTLQQYQYAARQVGVSNQAMENTFRALQESMTRTLMGEGAPEGLAQFALTVGDITPQDIDEFAKNPAKLLQKLQDYAQKEQNVGRRNKVLKSFGIGDDMIAALSRKAFTPDVLQRAPTYSEAEIKALDRANVAWDNLGTKIQMAFGRFNAMHGGKLVSDISTLTDSVLKLADAFLKLANTIKLFQWFDKAIKGWSAVFEGIASSVTTIQKSAADPKYAESVNKDLDQYYQASPSFMKSLFDFLFNEEIDQKQTQDRMERLKEIYKNKAAENAAKGITGPAQRSMDPASMVPNAYAKPWWELKLGESIWSKSEWLASPKIPETPKGGDSKTVQEINVNQTLNFQHDGTNPGRAAQSHKDAIQKAFRQMSAQAQGS